MSVTLGELERLIRACWSAETSDDPQHWDPANPADGQCGTTSYALRALLGAGEIVLARIVGTEPQQHHAWLRLPDGVDIDMTRDQFRDPVELVERTDIPEDVVLRKIAEPGELLLARVRERLAAQG